MNSYASLFEQQTGKPAPQDASGLEPLFKKIEAGELLPPRGQQAVGIGLPAHTLNDPQENPALFDFYQWVLAHCLKKVPNELSAKLIGMAFTCANIFKTDLPQPITLNPWQIHAMAQVPLLTKQAVIVENNGIFVWLHHLHPAWPLINQGGNNFNESYLALVRELEKRGMRFTYLGDLDSPGIRIADHLFQQLSLTPITTFTAIQSAQNVAKWLALYGHVNERRTKQVAVAQAVFQEELASVHLFGKYVEQEQLIAEYEELIKRWLLSSDT